MAEKLKFRHELKYLLNLQEAALLRARLNPIMAKDAHVDADGEYMIRSLYFDDVYHSAYMEKDSGIYARKKYRIRVYGCSDSVISFERKTKRDQYIHKESARITREELDKIMDGDYRFLEKHENPFLQELYYEFTSNILRPRVMVDYEREPFVMEAGDVRITFDKHVRGSSYFDLFDPDIPTVDVIPGNKVVLEVKFTQFLPSLLREILPPKSMENSAVSKFVLCCDSCPLEGEMARTKAESLMLKYV